MSKPAAVKSNNHEVTIDRGKVLRVNAKEKRITCKNGCVWVTQEGDLRDIVLSVGEFLDITTKGTTLINAIAASTIALGYKDGFA